MSVTLREIQDLRSKHRSAFRRKIKRDADSTLLIRHRRAHRHNVVHEEACDRRPVPAAAKMKNQRVIGDFGGDQDV